MTNYQSILQYIFAISIPEFKLYVKNYFEISGLYYHTCFFSYFYKSDDYQIT